MAVRKKQAKVCRICHRVVEGDACVMCGSSSLSEDWAGYLVIIDPKHSDIAKKVGIDTPGRYALKVR